MSSTTIQSGYERILVAVDFSSHTEAALKQAVWLARQAGATVTLAHTLPHLLRSAEPDTPGPRMKVLTDFLDAHGEAERYEAFELETRRHTDMKLRELVDRNAIDLDVQFKILQGEPFVEIIHTVRQDGYDLVLAGTRGLAAWEQFFVGSTAKRLIRKCPSSVWIVKAEHVNPPQAVLAATDFSDASRRAVVEGFSIAKQAGAEFHLLHVIDAMDMPEDAVAKMPQGSSLRSEINKEAQKRLDDFVESLHIEPSRVHRHLSCGTPWKDIGRLAQHLKIDLIAMGTIGRSGVKGLFLGNTAEKVLDTCDCSILTVKPADFVSPIETSSRQPQPLLPTGP